MGSDSIEIGKWDVDELLIEAGQLSSSDSDPFDSIIRIGIPSPVRVVDAVG